MTKRDLFRILIKVFGLYSGILTIFTVIPSNTVNLVYQFDTLLLLVILSAVLVSLGLFITLIFKTDAIIRLFKLDTGFDDEKIDLGSLTNQSILKLAVVIIGGFLIIDNVPDVLYYTVAEFRNRVNQFENTAFSVNYVNWIISVINVVIGLLFVSNYKKVALFLNKD